MVIENSKSKCVGGCVCICTTKYITNHFGVSSTTIRRWDTNGEINTVRFNGKCGKRLYCLSCISARLGIDIPLSIKRTTKLTVCYARVSSRAQEKKGDLERQIEALRHSRPRNI